MAKGGVSRCDSGQEGDGLDDVVGDAAEVAHDQAHLGGGGGSIIAYGKDIVQK